MKICKNCNEPNEDNAVICKNCLNKIFITYEEEKINSINKMEKIDKKRKINKILFWSIYSFIFIISIFVSCKNKSLDFSLSIYYLSLFSFSVLALGFTEFLCKLKYIFVIDNDYISISEAYLYFMKFCGIVCYIALIYSLLS